MLFYTSGFREEELLVEQDYCWEKRRGEMSQIKMFNQNKSYYMNLKYKNMISMPLQLSLKFI